MKICTAQIILALTFFGISVAHSNFAQILDKPVSIALTDIPFDQALKQIELAADVKFAYSISQLQKEKNVTLTIERKSLRLVLDQLLSSRDIGYTVHEKEGTIALKKYPSETDEEQSYAPVQNDPDAFLLTGVVTDATSRQPMAGVNIIIKGTTQGTTTDADGKFAIETREDDVLVFSFIGFTTQEVKLSGQSTLAIEMSEDITSLKEIVVNAGYWTVKKEQQTGNISKVQSGDIQKQPVSNPLATLQGRVPGLEIIQSSGVPGGNFVVRIRGRNSISNGNDPLYIIDGVPFTSASLAMSETSGTVYSGGTSPLNSINPSDIESIEVLKDADATAIYGSRGANGVILISTKRGKAGKTKVDLRISSGAGKVASKMELLTSPEYLEMRRESFHNSGVTPTPANAPDLVTWDTTRRTDWQHELLGGRASFTDANLTVSGGDRATQFSLSNGYHRETTVFPGDNYDQRIATNVTLSNLSLNQKLKTTVSFNYTINSARLLKRDLTSLALTLAPVAPPLYNDAGDFNWGPQAWNGFSINTHPLSYTKAVFESATNTLTGNIGLAYAILPNVELRVNAGVTSIAMKAITTSPISSLDPAYASVAQNSSVFASSSMRNWITEPQVSWTKKIGRGEIEALAGTSFLEQFGESAAQYGIGFSSEALMKNLNSADQILKASSAWSQYRYHAVFARINYRLNEKYIINLTGRRDGSSRFGPGKQFATFGAVGAAWIFSKEKFILESAPVLSFGKLRGSYGLTGNDQIGNYQYLDTYSVSGSGLYMGSSGLSPQRLYNPDFAWEVVKKLEFALEVGLFKDKLTLAGSFYRNRSSNQLVGNPLPPTTGFTTIQSNFPAVVQNSGVELELAATAVASGDVHWTIGANFTAPRNRLISFPNLESSQFASYYAVGEPLNIVKQYHYSGVDPVTGIYQYEDVNGDNSYTTADRQAIKFTGRQYYGGLSNTFRYKNLQLDILVEAVKQNGTNYLLYFFTTPGNQSNFPSVVMNRWQHEGDVTDVQKFTSQADYQTAYSRLQGSDRVVSDASFIRMKNISLSWMLPKTISSRASLDEVEFFFQAQNLFKITRFDGLDPESQSAVLPPLRVITAGIHLTL